MGIDSKREYYNTIRLRYLNASKREKTQILNEFCQNCGYNRKYAIRKLNQKPSAKREGKAGRKPIYSDIEIGHLRKIWLAMDQMCAVRLKAALPIWLRYYYCSGAIKKKLRKMSPATINRRLKPYRSRRGKCGTRPGSLLRTQIPIKPLDWDITKPGFVEADTVAHCGDSLQGNFIWSLTLTDIASGWTEPRSTWNKTWDVVKEQIIDIAKSLPFEILGFSSDNGGEFINKHLLGYFRRKQVTFTRSRPYKKNDNARVEQKNWSHVRQLFGYERFECHLLVDLMNDLYKNEWSQLQNFFCPTLKLSQKTRIGASIKKDYQDPQTPYQRILESSHVSHEKKEELRALYRSLNPFILKQTVERKLKEIFHTLREHHLRHLSEAA